MSSIRLKWYISALLLQITKATVPSKLELFGMANQLTKLQNFFSLANYNLEEYQKTNRPIVKRTFSDFIIYARLRYRHPLIKISEMTCLHSEMDSSTKNWKALLE